MLRFFDLLFATTALIILFPIFIIIIISLRLTGEGEVFYCQNRIGYDGLYFNLIKFATMLKDSPKMHLGTVTVENDQRILKFGKFLRNTKINELPQLINILKGDMSLIGPRPLTKEAFDSYSEEIKGYLKICKPGLSGVGSIIFRNEEKILNLVDDPKTFHLTTLSSYKGELEKWYVINRSVYLYFHLILATIIIVFFPRTNIFKQKNKDFPLPPDDLKMYLDKFK